MAGRRTQSRSENSNTQTEKEGPHKNLGRVLGGWREKEGAWGTDSTKTKLRFRAGDWGEGGPDGGGKDITALKENISLSQTTHATT